MGLSIQLLLVLRLLLSTGNESVYDAIDIIMYIYIMFIHSLSMHFSVNRDSDTRKEIPGQILRGLGRNCMPILRGRRGWHD